MRRPSRVVLDTNVVISGFLTPGNSRTLLLLAAQRAVIAFSSPFLEQELADVLRRKLRQEGEDLAHELATYRELIHRFVYPKPTVKIMKADPSDNRVLEAAVEAMADFLITGDKRLLALGTFRNIKIIRPSDFLLQRLG